MILGEIDGIPFDDTIFCSSNKSGYSINVNHPIITPYYNVYKAKAGAVNYALSDTQRKDFERYMFVIIHNSMQKYKEKPLTPTVESE